MSDCKIKNEAVTVYKKHFVGYIVEKCIECPLHENKFCIKIKKYIRNVLEIYPGCPYREKTVKG